MSAGAGILGQFRSLDILMTNTKDFPSTNRHHQEFESAVVASLSGATYGELLNLSDVITDARRHGCSLTEISSKIESLFNLPKPLQNYAATVS